jgi:DNA-binding NarL/FixJ family response regulator
MHILLADDQPKLRLGLKLLLKREPEFNISAEASDAESLWDQLKTFEPDVLLLDWELPGLNPVDALRRLRAVFPCLQVIALSGRVEARHAALAAGADAFVSKGSPPEQLLAALNAIWKKLSE